MPELNRELPSLFQNVATLPVVLSVTSAELSHCSRDHVKVPIWLMVRSCRNKTTWY
ncbi:hypothetical protein COLO4_15115 [Corchorus olitorius]|uniref:Uncharacterized protein n=1 Tax=Corchorus olitorius TaxID=93759 RepID=A0A1R3JPM6_9ROSI|nr:hypothetical protein COLO4_15115 [Corchorus olitorius]